MSPRQPLPADDRSSERWHSVFLNAPNHITIIDPGHRILFHNHPVPGLEPDEVLDHDVFEFIDPAFHEISRASFRAAFEEGRKSSYQSQATGPDGTKAHYEVQVAPVQASSPVTEVMIIALDVTERRDITERLHQSHRHLTALMEHTDDFFLIADEKGRPVLFNAAYARIMHEAFGLDMKPGIQPHRLIGDPETVAWWDGLHRRVLGGESFRTEYSHTFPDGRDRRFEICYEPIIESDEITGFTELTREITDRWRVEQDLRRNENRLRNLLESNVVGIFIAEENGSICEANDAFLRIIGYDHDDLLAGRVNWREMTPPEHAEKDRRILVELEKQRHSTPVEKEYIRKDGGRVPVYLCVAVLEEASHDFVCFVIDLTERHESERRERELQQRISRLERIESVGLLAGGVAHDLNNMLGPLVALPELIEMDLQRQTAGLGLDLGVVYRDIEVMRNSAVRAVDVIKDLVTIGRRGGSDRRVVDANEILRDYRESNQAEDLRRLAPTVRIEFDLHPEPLLLMGSTAQLLRVVANLATNAVESVEGDGRVVLRTRPVSTRRTLVGYEPVPPGDYVRIEVRDSGRGVSPEDLSRIFEPFFTRKSETENSGSGLGLSVVHGTVKEHGGYIDVASPPDGGTRFRLYLPRSEEPAPVAEPLAETVPAGDGEHILVVDDEPGQRFLARRGLEKLGYQVSEARDGREAISLLTRQSKLGTPSPYDLVLLDMIMADDLDGMMTWEEIVELYPDQKAFIASGHAGADRAEEVRAKGLLWLNKPYEISELARIVRRCLDD